MSTCALGIGESDRPPTPIYCGTKTLLRGYRLEIALNYTNPIELVSPRVVTPRVLKPQKCF